MFFFVIFLLRRDYDWSDDESVSSFDNMHQHDEYSHSEIINQCNFGSEHLINAHLSSQTCLQNQADSSTQHSIQQCLNSNDFDSDHGTEETIMLNLWLTLKSMNRLITNFEAVYSSNG